MKDERENMEWKNEYPTLKLVNPANAFVVPEGYFNEMEGQVMENIRLDEFKTAHPKQEFSVPGDYFNQLEQNIQSRVAIEAVIGDKQNFTVPADYFNELEGNIQSRVAIEEILAGDKGFTVPSDYFNELEGNVNSRIAIDELLNNEQSFTVPTDYFNELTQNIQSRIAIESFEEEEFTVPEGYFEALESKILAKTTLAEQGEIPAAKKQPVKVINMWAKHAVKYASAACFALVVGAGLFISEFNTTGKSHNQSYLHKAVAKMSNEDVEAYLQLNSDAAAVATDADADKTDLQSVIDAVQAKTGNN